MIKTIKYIACCLAGVIMLLPLQAQNVIRPKIEGPGNLLVNSYNGVLFFGLTDFETNKSAMPMQLRFYYNSSASKLDYGYGLGFSLCFEMRYQEDVIGGVSIESGDGRTDHFIKYGDEFKAPSGVFSTLSRPTNDTYLLTTKDGTKYFFDNPHHRKVTAIEDRNGNHTSFKYQDTLLIEAKDAVGHTISLSYTDGLLTQASSSFSPGKYIYEYDGLRRLRKRVDPMGNVTLYGYSRQNKINEITDANGNKTLIAYNNASMVSRIKTDLSDKSIRYDGDKTIFIDYTEPSNVYSYYRWDDKGRAIEKVGLCCGVQSTLKYDDSDNIVKSIDANGNSTKYTYDENGNLLSVEDPLGNSEKYTYAQDFNQISTYRDKNGSCFTFNYDTKGNLIALSGPLGFNYRYSYDEHGWQILATDPNGGVTRTTYNADGTIASIVCPDGGVINYSYDSYGRMVSESNPMGYKTLYTYDNLGRVISETDALGNVTTKTYDKVGNIVRVLDAAGNITAYTYDALGHITSMTDPMGGDFSYEYDGQGNIISVVDPQGIKQQMTYNDRSKIESYTNGAGEKTSFDYDVKGNLIAEMLPNGNVISYEYDELDRVIEKSDNMGLIAKYSYDGNGNQLTITDALDRTITYFYDALNRLTTETLPLGSTTTYTYDNNSNLLTITDAKGNITAYTYNSLNKQLSYTDGCAAKTQYEYDSNGNLTRIIDANGNVTSYAYNALNQNTAITFANGLSLQYSYDELGRMVAMKDRAGREFRYDYNALGNMITKTYPDGTKDKYTYDNISRLISAVNKDATVYFTYDQAGRILSETLNGKITSYSYDIGAGQRKLTYPSGMEVVEQLNARNLIKAILQNGEEVIIIDYNDAGQKINLGYGNGITTSYSYNENGWLKTINADQIMSLEMDYDAVGNITMRCDKLDDSRTESYGYDKIYQLTSFKRGTTLDISYQLDALGNRVKVVENGVATNYTTNNVNAYTAITGKLSFTPQYDNDGNLLNDDKHIFVYDFNNKLESVDGSLATYKYDALGRRIAKNNTSFYYVGDQMVEEVTNGVTISYLYGNNIDEALQMKRGVDLFYYHTNHLGSIMALSDNNGQLTEYVDYDVYGMPSFYNAAREDIGQSSVNNSILFTGREYDSSVGIYHYRARNQHPSIGRFMQKDSLIYVDGMNDLSYVINNPINYIDPYGFMCQLTPGEPNTPDWRNFKENLNKIDKSIRDNTNTKDEGWSDFYRRYGNNSGNKTNNTAGRASVYGRYSVSPGLGGGGYGGSMTGLNLWNGSYIK